MLPTSLSVKSWVTLHCLDCLHVYLPFAGSSWAKRGLSQWAAQSFAMSCSGWVLERGLWDWTVEEAFRRQSGLLVSDGGLSELTKPGYSRGSHDWIRETIPAGPKFNVKMQETINESGAYHNGLWPSRCWNILNFLMYSIFAAVLLPELAEQQCSSYFLVFGCTASHRISNSFHIRAGYIIIEHLSRG